MPIRAYRQVLIRLFAFFGGVGLPFRRLLMYGVKRPLPLSIRTWSTSFFASQ